MEPIQLSSALASSSPFPNTVISYLNCFARSPLVLNKIKLFSGLATAASGSGTAAGLQPNIFGFSRIHFKKPNVPQARESEFYHTITQSHQTIKRPQYTTRPYDHIIHIKRPQLSQTIRNLGNMQIPDDVRQRLQCGPPQDSKLQTAKCMPFGGECPFKCPSAKLPTFCTGKFPGAVCLLFGDDVHCALRHSMPSEPDQQCCSKTIRKFDLNLKAQTATAVTIAVTMTVTMAVTAIAATSYHQCPVLKRNA